MKRLTAGIIALAMILSLAGCSSRPEEEAKPETSPIPPVETAEPTPEPTPMPTPEPAPEPTPEPTPDIRSASLTIAGDIVLHANVYEDLLQPDGSYDFSLLFSDVQDTISETDYATCCFEGSMPGTGRYSEYPLFRLPDDLGIGLKNAGFDLVAMASNHGFDGGFDGLVHTLDVLDEAGLDHTGTYRSQEEREACGGVLLKDINGIKIAFLNYTYGSNGIPVENWPWAMDIYYNDYMGPFGDIDYEMVDADIAYAKSLEPDFIAVILHWGAEYVSSKQASQVPFGEYLFSQGVDLVLGGHPHVPQPMEMVEIDKGDGSTRDGYICYCLGNLVSGMNEYTRQDTTLTAMVQIELSKDMGSGEARIENVEYIPMATVDLYDFGVYGAGWRYKVWDLKDAIADYEAGDDRGVITPQMYQSFQQYLERIRTIMGTELEAGYSDEE